MGRPRATDPRISITISLPLSAIARLNRLAAALGQEVTPQLLGRNMMLDRIAAEESRLGLPPLVAETWTPGLLSAYAPVAPAKSPRPPTPPVAPPAPPPGAPVVPGEGPWLPSPGVVDAYFHPPPGSSPDDAFDALLPKPHS